MKKGTRIIIFLSAVFIYSSQIFAEGLREIKTLDEINKGITSTVTKPVSNINNELKPLEKLNTSEKKEEVKSETTVTDKSIESGDKLTDAQKALMRSGVKIIEISKKIYGSDKLVYAKGEDKPFTGEFALFLGILLNIVKLM